jgi:hypothetical protein
MFARTLYWQRLDQPEKRSSLFGLVVSDAEKKMFFLTGFWSEGEFENSYEEWSSPS